MSLSRPVRARGLKYIDLQKRTGEREVAPREGAWIEMDTSLRQKALWRVAPREGAWIEIKASSSVIAGLTSRPVRARGLKLYILRCRA